MYALRQLRAGCRLLAGAGVAAFMAGSVTAHADDLDSWCSQVEKASSIIICSDPELRQQAIARNRLFEIARQTLSPAAYKTLSED